MGFFKDFFWGVNELLTLGGQSELERSNERYAAVSETYELLFADLSQLVSDMKAETNLLGEAVIGASEKLQMARDLISNLSDIKHLKNTDGQHAVLNKIENFYHGYSHALVAGAGATIGSTLAVGSWALVSVVGSASTGAAISGLSGVAATNATLAWFGGGSLIAGGSGIAGGATVLGGVLLVPLVYFATKKSYEKAKEVDEATELVKAETKKLSNMRDQYLFEYFILQERSKTAISICTSYVALMSSLLSELRPMGWLSQLKEFIYRTCRKSPFSKKQLDIVEKIKIESDKFIDALNSIG